MSLGNSLIFNSIHNFTKLLRLRLNNDWKRTLFVIIILVFSFIYAFLYWNIFSWEDPVQEVQIVNNHTEKLINNFKLVEKVPPILKEERKSQTLNPTTKQIKFQTKQRSKRPQTAEFQNQQLITNKPSTADPLIKNGLRAKSEINYYLRARQLVLLTVRKMNLMLSELKNLMEDSQRTGLKFPCAEWWADPTNIIRYEINASSLQAETHFLDFEAESKFERCYFRVVIEINISSIPNKINIISIRSWDQFRHSLRRLYGPSCLPPNITTNFANITGLCSCELEGYVNFYPWPVHSNFFAGDYLNNYKDLQGLFNALPENSTGRYCGSAVRLLVLVTSAPKHFGHRETIRATYGSKENLVKNKADLVFFIGRVADSKIEDQLRNEAKKYQDIVRPDFLDSYNNLTLKHLSMYAFVYHVCSGKNSLDPTDESFNAPTHVLKVDDDFVENLPIAYKVAMANPDAELIGCSFCSTKPVLNAASKYYTPKYKYLGEFLPGYLSGVTYLLRTDIIPKFLDASLTVPFIHMDDVYIGILAAFLKIYPRHSNLFGYWTIGAEKAKMCELKKMANSWMLNGVDLEDMKAQWESLNSTELGNNCTSVAESELKVYNLTIDFMKHCRYEL